LKQTAKDVFGYHKPIMLAGGLGNIRTEHVEKGAMQAGLRWWRWVGRRC
jgi:phosphoribosylformylglycinamidine synthase